MTKRQQEIDQMTKELLGDLPPDSLLAQSLKELSKAVKNE